MANASRRATDRPTDRSTTTNPVRRKLIGLHREPGQGFSQSFVECVNRDCSLTLIEVSFSKVHQCVNGRKAISPEQLWSFFIEINHRKRINQFKEGSYMGWFEALGSVCVFVELWNKPAMSTFDEFKVGFLFLDSQKKSFRYPYQM